MVPEVTEPNLKPTTNPSGPAPPTTPKLLQQPKESMSLLELDFKFKELTLARLPKSDSTQQLRQDSQAAMTELKETQRRLRQLTETQTIRELEEENTALRAQVLRTKQAAASRHLSFSRETQATQ